MSLITRLPAILETGRTELDNRRKQWEEGAKAVPTFQMTEEIGDPDLGKRNMAAAGDNAAFMEYLLGEKKMGGQLKLIYVDPPYFSNASYTAGVRMKSKASVNQVVKQNAYDDLWQSAEDYLSFLTYRLLLMKELLAEDGAIWVHLDWHMVHYVKVIMDEIFGEKNFINEVIWTYKSGGASKRHFARKHDTLLYYGKSDQYCFKPMKEKSYNRELRAYRFKGVEEYKDDVGWYTLVSQKDVWQIDMVGRTSSERTGYATQKPEQLLSRILLSCTEEGDLCADFFGGSGTLAAVCSRMNRRFIHCDGGQVAEVTTKKRLAKLEESYQVYRENGIFKVCGKINTKITLQQDSESGKINLCVELIHYQSPHKDEPPVEKKNQKTVKAALEEEPLSAADFWCIDWDYDGEVFRPGFQKEITSDEGSLKAEESREHFGRLAVKVYDVFGGSVMEIFTIK